MATGWATPKPENLNFARLCRLLIDGGTRALRDVFDSIHSPSSLHSTLLSTSVHATLKGLRGKRILTIQQWGKLYPSSKSTPVTSADFDITLLFVLLRNVCGLTPPPTGWDKLPAATDLSREADLARVKYYRNELYGHTTETAVSDSEFEKYWSAISDVLVRLGGPHHQPEIDRLKITAMDVEDEKYFIKILEEWEQTEQSLKTVIKDTGEQVKEELKKTEQSLKTVIKDTGEQVTEELIETEQSLKTVIKDTGEQVTEELIQTEQSLKTVIKDTGEQVTEELKKTEQSFKTVIKDTGEQVMDKLGEMEGKLGDRQSVTNVTMYNITVKDHGPSTSLPNIEGTSANKDLSTTKAQEYTEKLKSSIKKQTDFLLSEEEEKKVRTDDIFTNVIIERGQKQFKEPKETRYGRRRMDEVQPSRTALKTCSEMFVYPENDQKSTTSGSTTNPKSILLRGKGGIGKTLFCRKLARDWACDQLLEEGQQLNAKVPDFQFVFHLTFRQFLFPETEKVDLRGILNKCSLLDEHSVINEPLLQYIIKNPEKLLIILDGYDEYKQREKITGDFEERYTNDPHEEIPVPALIAKIMKGKMLKDSVVIVSSRPDEAEELKKMVFDVRCDIQGFSSLQVQEYICKYFRENESMKKQVLDHIKANEILLSFGHVPVMCFLMCYCIKWYMTESKNTEKLPVTRTELYYEVIKLFIKKHSSSKYEELKETKANEILHKLAELAMNLFIERKYIFDENDMKNFKFTNEEITNLKASGLLDCCPGVKKSPSDKPPLEFTFTHLTIQEFLCAFSLVEKKQIPKKEETSAVTLEFVAGILSMKKDEKLMEELIENIKPEDKYNWRNKLLTLSCLYEYKDDGFSTRVIKNLGHRHCEKYGRIGFSHITDIDCLYISYLFKIVNLIHAEQTTQQSTSTQSFIVKSLYIDWSSLSPSGYRMLCDGIVRVSTLTELRLWHCKLDDECVKIICDVLSSTHITALNLSYNNITDVGVMCLCSKLKTGDCRVKVLGLGDNDEITDECKQHVRKLIPDVEWIFRKLFS